MTNHHWPTAHRATGNLHSSEQTLIEPTTMMVQHIQKGQDAYVQPPESLDLSVYVCTRPEQLVAMATQLSSMLDNT